MNLFALNRDNSTELYAFQHIVEFSKVKIQSVQTSLKESNENKGLRFIFILEGKFEWKLDDKEIIIYPNDLVIIYPNQYLGSKAGYFENGTYYSITLSHNDTQVLGKWSHFSESEQILIKKLLFLSKKTVLQNLKNVVEIFKKIEIEIFSTEIGYKTRVNELLDELIILVARQLNRQENERRDFPETFQKFDQILRENLSHTWTVEEMAAVMGFGTTAFNEKMKSYSGFTPLNYLINLRITEAIRMLKLTNRSLTDIAMEMGFYSSQHFSTTFKKLTGYTPGYFRKGG